MKQVVEGLRLLVHLLGLWDSPWIQLLSSLVAFIPAPVLGLLTGIRESQ